MNETIDFTLNTWDLIQNIRNNATSQNEVMFSLVRYFVKLADEVEVALPSCSDAKAKGIEAWNILMNSSALTDPKTIFAAFSANKLKLMRDVTNAMYYWVAQKWYLVAWNMGDMANMVTSYNGTMSAF